MSRWSRVAASLALAGMAPVPGLAQEPVRGVEPAAEPFEMRLERGPDRVIQFVMNRRARLGLKVNLRARSSDSIGAYVDAVTPNGPAAQAGIQSGDIITKLDGKSVLAGGRAEAPRERESLPGLRLIELAAKLEPNDTIPVELRRGKERKTVSVVTADEPDILLRGDPNERSFAFRLGPNGPSGRAMVMPLDEDFEGTVSAAPTFLYRSPLAELELAPLNPDLGRYFGATEGILVINVPKDSELKLKAGDVVLSVDGRKPSSPAHLLRIMRSYERGESFKLDVLRNGKRESVTGRIGDRAADG